MEIRNVKRSEMINSLKLAKDVITVNSYIKETVELLSMALGKYDDIFSGQNYRFLLSNEQLIDFSLNKKQLPHIIGFEYQNIRVLEIQDFLHLFYNRDVEHYNFTDLFNIVRQDPDFFYRFLCLEGKNHINVYRINIKCRWFLSFCDSIFKLLGFIDFDRMIFEEASTINSTARLSRDINGIFFFPKENGQTLFLGITGDHDMALKSVSIFEPMYDDGLVYFWGQDVSLGIGYQNRQKNADFTYYSEEGQCLIYDMYEELVDEEDMPFRLKISNRYDGLF